MPVQLSYTQRNEELLLGQVMDNSQRDTETKIARGIIKAGYGVFKAGSVAGAGTQMLDPGEVYQIPNPGAAADVDAIVTAFTTSTGVQTLSGTALNGAVGGAEMQPPRLFTATLNAHADWDATNLTLIGVDYNGQLFTELLAIPDGGNATLTSTTLIRSITSISVPEQSGAGGTATFGITALSTLTIADYRGVALRQPVKTTVATSSIYGYPGLTSTLVTGDYVDAESVPVLYRGPVAVFTEEAVSDGDYVYVRISAGAGGSVLGAYRNDADTASCVLVPNARFVRDAASGIAWMRQG